jgi:hypothetical protein
MITEVDKLKEAYVEEKGLQLAIGNTFPSCLFRILGYCNH